MAGSSSPRRPAAGPSSLSGANPDSSPAPTTPSPPGETPRRSPQNFIIVRPPNASNRVAAAMPAPRHTLTVPDTTEEHSGGSSRHTLTVPGNQTEDHQGGTSGHTLTVTGQNEDGDGEPTPPQDDEPARPAQGKNENEHDQAPSSRPAGVTQRQGQVPRSVTTYINPLVMHPPNVVASATMPLTARPGNVEASRPETRPRVLDDDPLGVMASIKKMQEETARLKGKNNQATPRRIPASKTSMFSKPKDMLKRVTTAVGKQFLGSSHSKEQSNKPQHGPLQENEAEGVPTIERRLNEGANLNRKKVQHLTGGKVKRKPVPGQQMSTKKEDWAEDDLTDDEFSSEEKTSTEEPGGRTRFRDEPQRRQQVLEDPFSGLSPTDRPRPEFERRLRASSRTSHATAQPQQDDPFAEEGILQSDTNSPLDIAPENASTPRDPGARTVRESSESPTRRAPSGPGGSKDPTIHGGPGWI